MTVITQHRSVFIPVCIKDFLQFSGPLDIKDLIAFLKFHVQQVHVIRQENPAVARKPRDAAAVLFSLKFADDITSLRVAKLRKPGFRAPNIPAQNRI